MPDLTGLPLRANNSLFDDIGDLNRLGGTISSVASDSSIGKELDDRVARKRNKLEPLSRN